MSNSQTWRQNQNAPRLERERGDGDESGFATAYRQDQTYFAVRIRSGEVLLDVRVTFALGLSEFLIVRHVGNLRVELICFHSDGILCGRCTSYLDSAFLRSRRSFSASSSFRSTWGSPFISDKVVHG